MDVQPFTIDVPDSVLWDRKDRLERTRWPDDSPGSDWEYGSNLAYIFDRSEEIYAQTLGFSVATLLENDKNDVAVNLVRGYKGLNVIGFR